jgi:hypothetical protein
MGARRGVGARIVPSRRQSPIAFWFWNGALDGPELIRQMRLLREAGIHEFVIHARSGLATEYLSDDWFSKCGAVVAEAERTDMRLWIYDEMNWPSGSAGGKVTAHSELIEHYIDEHESLREYGDARKRLSSPDFLSRSAVQLFLHVTHERYREHFHSYFGRTIRGFFNDEMRFANARPWSLELPDHRACSVADRTRIAGRAFREVYVESIAHWCTENNLLLLGHVMGEESLASQVRYLGGDLGSILSHYHVPGIDHLGCKAEGLHPFFLASAAFFMGNPLTVCETGAALPWDFTPIDLRRVTGWLYAHGVRRQVLHGFFYEENQADWSPDMFFRWKYWEEMKSYIAWAGRIQAVLDSLTPNYRVALYHPVDEFTAGYRPNRAYTLDYEGCPPIAGERALSLHKAMQDLPSALKERHVDFVFVTRSQLQKAGEMILIVPAGCHVDFPGTTIHQEDMSAAEVAEYVLQILDDLPRIEGAGATCMPLDTRADIADPYLHRQRDEGGVVMKSYRHEGGRVISLWNAEPTAFHGTVDTGYAASWESWNPQSESPGAPGSSLSRKIDVQVPAYSFVFLQSEG